MLLIFVEARPTSPECWPIFVTVAAMSCPA
jgi:hypothetical protein